MQAAKEGEAEQQGQAAEGLNGAGAEGGAQAVTIAQTQAGKGLNEAGVEGEGQAVAAGEAEVRNMQEVVSHA
ncbi:hypothetical protein D3C74_422250 [compost metagenome]